MKFHPRIAGYHKSLYREAECLWFKPSQNKTEDAGVVLYHPSIPSCFVSFSAIPILLKIAIPGRVIQYSNIAKTILISASQVVVVTTLFIH